MDSPPAPAGPGMTPTMSMGPGPAAGPMGGRSMASPPAPSSGFVHGSSIMAMLAILGSVALFF